MMKPLVICCLFGLVGSLQAQVATPTPRPTPPPGPLLEKFAPEFASWSVNIKRIKPADAATPAPAGGGASASHRENPASTPTIRIRVTMTKTGAIRREEQVDERGESITKWYQGTMQVTSKSGWARPVLSSVVLNPMDSLLTDYSHTDFPGFEWISADTYVGINKVADHDCLIFKGKSSLLSEGELKAREELAIISAGGNKKAAAKIDPEQFQSETVACVDLETRLPVALQRSDETRTYQFLAAPEAMLVLPPEIKAPLDQWNKARAMMNQPSSRPY